MKKHQTVQVLTAGQMKDLAAAVVEAIPQNLSFADAEYWIGNKGKMGKEIKQILFRKKDGKFADLLFDWQNFWKGITGKEYDFSNVVVPQRPEGRWRLLIIVDIALETLYAKCKERFNCWRWTNDDFDKIVIWNERDAKSGPYAIWVKDEVEADEDLKNKSANDIKKEGTATETLAERLVHELKFFDETGRRLDVVNITLCAGSRFGGGGVPCVRWSEGCGRVSVGGCSPGSAVDGLRSRVAVS